MESRTPVSSISYPGIKVLEKGTKKSRLLIIYIKAHSTEISKYRDFFLVTAYITLRGYHSLWGGGGLPPQAPLDPTDIKLQNWMLEAKFCYPVIIMCDFKVL
jgi:hypothetical protein